MLDVVFEYAATEDKHLLIAGDTAKLSGREEIILSVPEADVDTSGLRELALFEDELYIVRSGEAPYHS